MIKCGTSNRGFTLVELLVVIVVMAVVAAGVLQFNRTSVTGAHAVTCNLKNLIAELREIAIANNCHLTVKLDRQSIEIFTHTEGGRPVATRELAVALGDAPQPMTEIRSNLAEIDGMLNDVTVRCRTADGGSQSTLVFTENGSLKDHQDRHIFLNARDFPRPSRIVVHGFTGLLEQR